MIRAVLFDVDGTLYHQGPLRAAMACELALTPCVRGPREARRVVRVLRAFRRVREELRASGRSDASLDGLQFALTARRTDVDTAAVRAIVDEWIFTRPLRHVRRFRRAGLVPALAALERAGIQAGVFSDYPTRAKVDALGLTRAISVHVCATDAQVNAFKPHPRGFLTACELWRLSPHEVVYVGDRADVDAAGAAAAGMSSVILGRADGGSNAPFISLRSFHGLASVLAPIGESAGAAPAVAIGER